MENPESRIAPSSEPASDDSASPVHPQPGAPDRLAFEPVPLRYREDGLTPERQRAYVEALADCGVARAAAARVGLSEQAINRVRRRTDARSFDNACEAAHLHGARRLRSIAYERAIEGTLKGRYYRGELVGQERVYDNRLLTYLLGKVAHLLDPPGEARAICDDWQPHMEALEQGLPPPPPRAAGAAGSAGTEWTGHEAREDEDGIWWTGFPPPAGFDGEEQGEYGDDDYERTLSAQEQAVVDAELDREDAEQLASETARRDRFFGFPGGGIPCPTEAEPRETSKSDPDLGPIEYKSLVPPSPTDGPRRPGTHGPSSRRKPEPMNAQARISHRHVHGSRIKSGMTVEERPASKPPLPARAPRRTFPPPGALPR
ncbi:MAG: hypothetical protein QOJ27_306 [Sphingomonadales bacterium]|nr:hypothetical protein [Sphingomonadales bacterium]